MPTLRLAEAIAEEWRVQGDMVVPDTMPLMQLAATVLDHIMVNRAAIETVLLRFAETDLVSYRAEAPIALVKRQVTTWNPLVDWLAEAYKVRLKTTTGVLPVNQSADSIESLGGVLAAMSDWKLGAFQAAAAPSGSFVIALALVDGRIDADQAFDAAELDASFEIERWGEDTLATERRAAVAFDLAAAGRFNDLLRV